MDQAALDDLIDTFEHKSRSAQWSPRSGTSLDGPCVQENACLTDAPAAIAELGYTSGQGEHTLVVENTPKSS